MKYSPYQFTENQKVMLRVPKSSDLQNRLISKFFVLYEGPYTISRIPHPNVADLVDEAGHNKGRYNFFNLKPFHE